MYLQGTEYSWVNGCGQSSVPSYRSCPFRTLYYILTLILGQNTTYLSFGHLPYLSRNYCSTYFQNCHEISVQFSHSVMSDSLRPHELQHVRHPCPSPTPGVYSTHVHLVGDAIQPSHPLLSLSPAPNPSQPQSLFP